MILDKKNSLRSSLELWAVLGTAFLLRVAGISFGPYYPDEHLIINHALAFGTGDLNPHMFYFSSLFLYILFFVYGCFYGAGFLAGRFHGPEDALNLYIASPEVFYVLGRLVSVVFGTLTVVLVYRLAREYRGKQAARCAALWMTVCFLHVRDSHLATMDVTLTFFTTLSVFWLFRLLNKGERRYLFLAAATAGVAAAVKYNGFILGVPIVAAYFLSPLPKKHLLRDGFLCGAAMIAAFFVCSPYVFLDFQNALWFIRRLYGINQEFHLSWWHHGRMIFFSLGGFIPFFAAGGFLKSLFQVNKKNILFFSLPVIYYAMITKAGQPFERYVLVILPFAVIWAACFLEDVGAALEKFLKRPLKILPWLCAAVFLSALPKVLWSDALFLRADTRDLTRQWMEKNAPQGSAVVVLDTGQVPKLAITPEQLEEKIRALESEPGPLTHAKKLRLQKLSELKPYPSPSYRMYYLGSPEQDRASFIFLGPWVDADPESLRRIGADYLMIDSVSLEKFRDSLEAPLRHARPVASFDPRRSLVVNLSPHDWAFMPIDGTLWNYQRNGPWIHVFQFNWNDNA